MVYSIIKIISIDCTGKYQLLEINKLILINLLLARTVEDLSGQEVILTTMDDSVEIMTAQPSSQRGSGSLRYLWGWG